MANRSIWTQTALVLCVISMAAGCSSTSSSAPFHMYSSPLLDSEMATPDAENAADADRHSRPGVEPRSVYVYQRRHTNGETVVTPSQTARASNGPIRAPLDTVEPSSEPVLANYDADSDDVSSSTPTSETDGDETDRPEQASTNIDPDDGRKPSMQSAQYIYAVLNVNGVEFDEKAATNIPALYRQCRSRGEVFHSEQPEIGDLVFFHNTYDANDDGRNNDWYTQVGIIQDIRTDGTVEFVAKFDGDVEALRMNLDDVEKRHDATGSTVNSQLRPKRSDDPPYTQYLAGQLFASFCDILGDRRELILIDEWPL